MSDLALVVSAIIANGIIIGVVAIALANTITKVMK